MSEFFSLAEQEFRNDLDVYLRGNPSAQLGYELVRRGDYQIKPDVIPEGYFSDLMGFAAEVDALPSARRRLGPEKYDSLNIDESKGLVYYNAGPNYVIDEVFKEDGEIDSFTMRKEDPVTDTDMRVLSHELSHVAADYLAKKLNKDYYFRGRSHEEAVVRVGDDQITQRLNLPLTRFSNQNPTSKRNYNPRESTQYKRNLQSWFEFSEASRLILEEEFNFIPEVQPPTEERAKTYFQKFQELFTFGN